MQYIFTALYDFFENRRKLFWFCLALLFGLCLLGASRIRFVDDINKMIPHDPGIEAMNDVLSKTKTGEQIIFTLSFKDSNATAPDSLISLQEHLQEKLLQGNGAWVKTIQAQVNEDKEQQFSALALQYLPLLLDEHDYTTIDSLVQPERIRATLEKEHRLLLSPAGIVAKQWIAGDPIGMVPLAFNKLKSLHFDPGYELYNGYIFSKDSKRLTFFLELKHPASETGINGKFFKQLDGQLQDWNRAHPGLHTSYFGGPAVAAGNASQMRADTILTLSITIALLLALTFYVFRRKRAPLLLMVPVVFAAVFGLAVTALVQGSISLIALGAGAVILGIAMDFSVHFMSHARLHKGMRSHVKALAFPLTLGAFTTIGAFFALRFAHAPLLQDLGTFAAASLTGASLFTLIFLPHLLKGLDGSAATTHAKPNFIDRLAGLRPEGNKWLLLAVIAATPVLWHYAKKVQFDGDLMHLNYMSPALQQAQEELNRNNAYALSSVFVVAKEQSAEAAARKMEAVQATIQNLQARGAIRNSINPAVILPSLQEQQRRISRWQQFWTGERIDRTLSAVQQYGKAAGFSANAFADFGTTLRQTYSPFDTATTAFLQQLVPGALAQKGAEHYAIATLKVAPGARKAVLDAFGHSPDVIATDRQSVSERLLQLLNHDFNRILLYSGLLVFLALLIAYGRIELALISFLPMALTWIWILGMMSIFGLKFNIVNIIISTLIFGLGDDYSIFMMDSLMEKYRTGQNNIRPARAAVYLSVLTTVIGLGTLIFAKHPALQSIALVATLGLVCVVFVSQVLQPFLFNFMIQHRADKGFMPFTLWSLFKSAFSFLYFFTGCLLVTLAGLLLTGLRPFGRARSKYLFHLVLSKYTGSVMYVMTNIKKRVIKMDAGVFGRPAVYIANHSSFLDILITTMLHPRLVLLTNKWVWRSPVFGKIVRMAEYYPVADGAEDSIEPLRSLVARGYGIVVFPEGTRSYDDQIHRFHKGAFYIAEQLQLDVVPVVLHGVHYAMQKGDWLLKDGIATAKIHPPIRANDSSFGTGYRERTKQISRWFRQAFAAEKAQNETPRYFREQIIKSHIYKGPVLEWYCRVKTALEGNYEPFHELLPRAGKFYDLGCGYGFMTYMLHWASEERRFIGVDYDENKIETAQHNYKRLKRRSKKEQATLTANITIPEKIRFEQADLSAYTLEACDGIIISDVLHYLLPEQQLDLLNRSYTALQPGGILIIRDGVKELADRHKGTRRTEVWSTQIVNFNKTQNELHFLSKDFLENWAKEKGLATEVIDLSKKTSNLIFVMRKN
ncbi:trifunctional MMPL family transporter/lysophospholipid acyltransferase/class I SAM-dependent methyltransferase [Taibaiella chishuiensis]|uniref:1-acyl-sn-glycerol-3-phosphate acyltransferase n=1 Tax=Taibaiella chishuiensis TaxID=1434707 RepID=A0A2P8DC17_9BACT|nr:trifunctional MMPL family transporter/lysophospholipid acyltransferase/class I SAM-dependent methyltransferase [Taibaiella chishuiensis]PSK94760.1 1-acyl-sn-glycerol-3-phosphate acyltransferase [Taibaiella chishuiensis]